MSFHTSTGILLLNSTTPLLLHLNYLLFFFRREVSIQEYTFLVITEGLKKISAELELQDKRSSHRKAPDGE